MSEHIDSFEGKVAVVTGAGCRSDGVGIGRAAAIVLARSGARTVLIDRSRVDVGRTQEMIAEEGGASEVIVADVSDEAQCRSVAERTMAVHGRIDILCNIVGVAGPAGNCVDVDLSQWDPLFNVNLKSIVMMSRYVVPHMAKRGSGAIIMVSSVAGIRGGHPSLLYPTSKGAIVSLTRSMAAHHGHQGIRVNCVAPGLVYTPMVSAGGMPPELRQERRMRSALETEGTAWDVAYAIRYLVSDAARWVTGVVLPVDAGFLSGRRFYNREQEEIFHHSVGES